MEGKCNIQIGHVNNQEKQKVSVTYYLGSFDSVKEAQEAKYALDKVAAELGAEISENALIIGKSDDDIAKKGALEITTAIKQ